MPIWDSSRSGLRSLHFGSYQGVQWSYQTSLGSIICSNIYISALTYHVRRCNFWAPVKDGTSQPDPAIIKPCTGGPTNQASTKLVGTMMLEGYKDMDASSTRHTVLQFLLMTHDLPLKDRHGSVRSALIPFPSESKGEATLHLQPPRVPQPPDLYVLALSVFSFINLGFCGCCQYFLKSITNSSPNPHPILIQSSSNPPCLDYRLCYLAERRGDCAIQMIRISMPGTTFEEKTLAKPYHGFVMSIRRQSARARPSISRRVLSMLQLRRKHPWPSDG